MKLRPVLFIAFSLIFFACSKDKFQTKPSLKIKDINTTDVQVTQSLIVTFEYTDKEGDIGNGKIGVLKTVPNCPASDFLDTVKYKISGEVPSSGNQLGELEITFPYIYINPRCATNDTATFKFWVTDRAGNRSDTVTSKTIIIRK
jgi:hypothetical protein